MVNLPEVPTRIVTTQIPQNNISASDIERPFDMIAGAMEKVGGKLHEGAVAQAQQEGQNAVYRDDQGNLKVDFRSNFTETGRAYDVQAHQQYVAAVSNDIITQGTRLQQEANGDPAVFQKSWQAFSRGLVQNAPPPARGAVQIQAGNEGARLYDGVITQKLHYDTEAAKGAFDARKQQLEADMGSLAYNGGVDTPDFKRMQQEYRGIWEAQVANPRMAVSQQEAEIQISRASSVHMAEAVVGETQRTFARPVDQGGGIVAAEQAARKILTDSSMQLSLPERQQYFGVAMSEIRAQNAAMRQERIMLMPQVRDTEQQLKLGQGIDDPSTYDLIKQLGELGDGPTATRLIGLQNAARHIVGFNQMGAADRASMAAAALGRAPSAPPPVPADAGPRISKSVSPQDYFGAGVNVSSLPAGMRNNNPGNIKYTSGASRNFAGVVGPSQNTDQGDPQIVFSSPQAGMAAAAQLIRRKFDGGKTTVDQIIASNGGWTPGNHQAAANIARTMGVDPNAKLNLNDPGQLKSFMQGLVLQEHGAKSKLYDDMVFNEAVQHATGQTVQENAAQVNAPAPRFTAEEIKAYQAGVTHDFEVNWPKIKDGLAKGLPPTAEELATLATQVAVVNKPEVREDVAATLEGYGKGYLLSQLPPAQAEQVTSAIRSGMGDGGYTQAQRTMLGALDDSQKATVAALKDDPHGYAQGQKVVPVPPPLDFSNPQVAQQAMGQRETNAGVIREMYRQPDVSALRPLEAQSVGATIATAPVQQAQVALDALAHLSNASLIPTLSQAPIKDAISGATRSTDPARFSAAMTALDQMWSRAPQSVQQVFGGEVINRLQDWQADLRYSTPQDLADKLKTIDDPQTVERRKRLATDGEDLARKQSDQSVLDGFGSGGIFSRHLQSVDPITMNMMRADYDRLFGQRYASTLDATTAKDQALQRMRNVWQPSDVNLGRVTLYPPEHYYDTVNGSFDWMRNQIQDDLKAQNGGKLPENYVIVADRQTQAEVDAHARDPSQPAPSYHVIVQGPTGEFDAARDATGAPLRYRWDISRATAAHPATVTQDMRPTRAGMLPVMTVHPAEESARDRFARERARVMALPPPITRPQPGFLQQMLGPGQITNTLQGQ